MGTSTAFVRTDLLLTDDQRTGDRLGNSRVRLRRLSVRFAIIRQAMFESPTAGATSAPRFLTVSLASELGILLALSVMFPFLIHILPVPDDARLGQRLLPMFYAPLLASLLGRTRSAVIVALVAPWLNWALTMHPAPRGAIVMMFQLLAFVFVVRAMLTGFGARWYLAAPAYIFSVAVSMIVAAGFPDLVGVQPVLAWAANSVTVALPGVAVLVLINWLAVRFLPSGPGGGGPQAA